MDGDGALEHTLHVCREVKVYRIPPRPPTGHKSGDWKVADEVFIGRLRVVAIGEMLEVRFEDPNSGELFATSPIPSDKKDAYVEAVTDSSRYFVIRVEDPASKRHAFLGMGFAERGDAFDFNVALSDHVRHCKREAEISKVAEAGGDVASLASEDAKVLYQPHKDLSLKEGQTIHLAVKPGGLGGSKHRTGGFLSSKAALPLAPPPGAVGLLAPPPPAPLPPLPQHSAAPTSLPHQQEWSSFSDFQGSTSEEGWAKFD